MKNVLLKIIVVLSMVTSLYIMKARFYFYFRKNHKDKYPKCRSQKVGIPIIQQLKRIDFKDF